MTSNGKTLEKMSKSESGLSLEENSNLSQPSLDSNTQGTSCSSEVKAVFQTLLGSPYTVLWPYISFGRGCPRINFQQTHVGRLSVLPGLPRPTDRSHPHHHPPSIYANHCIMPPRPFFPHVGEPLMIASRFVSTFTCQLWPAPSQHLPCSSQSTPLCCYS